MPGDRTFATGEFEKLVYRNDGINEAFLADVREKRIIRHVFISYVSEDLDAVRRLSGALEARGINVWTDKERLKPGVRWEQTIVDAIREGLYFIACFSANSESKQKTFQRKEIRVALNEMSLMRDEEVWFIPVKLSACEIPSMTTGDGLDIRSLQWIDLSFHWNEGIERLADLICLRSVR